MLGTVDPSMSLEESAVETCSSNGSALLFLEEWTGSSARALRKSVDQNLKTDLRKIKRLMTYLIFVALDKQHWSARFLLLQDRRCPALLASVSLKDQVGVYFGRSRNLWVCLWLLKICRWDLWLKLIWLGVKSSRTDRKGRPSNHRKVLCCSHSC